MAIFRGVGGSGDSSDNSFLQEVTAQANAAEASATSAANSLAAIQETEVTSASFNTSDGVFTLTKTSGGTVTTDLDGRYAGLTGATFTGDVLFNDGVKAKFGTDSDLAIYHTDGGNSIIEETGEGALVLKTNGSAFAVLSDDNEYMINATVDGGVNLYNDGTLRLSVGSTLVSTSAGADFRVGSNSFFVDESDDKVGINTLTPSETLDVDGNIKASGTLATGGYTLSSTDGANGHALVTDGSGNVSFADVATDISGKANLSGDTFTGNVRLSDDVELRLGDGVSGDLRIFHSSGNNSSTIREQGTGNFFIKGNNLFLSDTSGNNYFYGVSGSFTKIYYNGSTKLETKDNGVGVTGNITVSGTVDGRDVATDGSKLDGIEASADVTDTANVTSAGALMDSEVTNLAQVKAFDSSDYATATQGTTADNALPKAGGQMTGNITFSGTQTVDGRDLSVDGSKLDNLLYSRTSDAQLTFFVDTALTTLPTTKGRCFSLATPFDCVRFVDVEFELTYNASTSSNDIIVTLGLVVPSGTHTVHNLGTATLLSDSAYTNGYADRWFSVDGDKSHLFSQFCGVADSSTPSSPTYVNAWVYRADLDKTYFNAGTFGTNGINNGDTVYLHPFDWENSGTVIQENYNMDSTTAYGLQSDTKGFRVKTAYDDSRLEYRVIAREVSSTDTASIKNITVLMTDYEV